LAEKGGKKAPATREKVEKVTVSRGNEIGTGYPNLVRNLRKRREGGAN